nr:MAG TPA: hypothetical protein [Crassvirales sp.]DAU12030.1 MAG TPA: hypothetical protein [Caudoviricetes sp.]
MSFLVACELTHTTKRNSAHKSRHIPVNSS